MTNYEEVEYPQGINKTYVRLLCEYLTRRYNLCLPELLLDVGAGTGDYWQTFLMECYLNALPISWKCNLEKKWSVKSKLFGYVFCKSVLEHITNTQHFLSETRRVLKPDGLAIFLVPDWNSQWKNFYDDSTHIKPFTKKGLEQAFKLAGFKDVQCEYFYQLPFTWRHRWLKWIPYVVRLLPDTTKYRGGKQNVLIRFSKERMLLLTARK